MIKKKPSDKNTLMTPRRKIDAATRGMDMHFRLLLENLGDVLWFGELEPRHFEYVSPSFEQIWGISTEELYKNPSLWEDFIHAEDRPRVRHAMQQWFNGEMNHCRLEYRVVNSRGETHWLADHGSVIGRKDGRPCKIAGIVRDITSSKTDDVIPARLAAVVESSDDAIITLDLASLIQTWNEGAERIFGYKKQEVLGRHVAFLRPPESADDEAVFLDHIRCGKRIHHYETRRQCKDGRIIDISLTLSPLRDNTGQIIGFSKISRDITERKLATQRFHDLLEAAPDALIISDRSGRIHMVNAQALRLFGFTREQLIGQSVGKLIAKGKRQSHTTLRKDFLANPLKREQFRGLEFPGLRSDGSEFAMEINLSQIQTAADSYIISDIIDITKRKQAEQAIRELNAELEMRVEQRTAELSRVNEELRTQIAMRLRLEEEILRISEHEQRRIGQDLHDDLGQQLAGAWMMSGVLERNLRHGGTPGAEAAAGISGLLEKALAQTRNLARGLHPVSPADGGLMVALEELAGRTSAMFGIRCQWECLMPVLVEDQTVATHLYRIAQEAVSNAVKHGRAKRVVIQLSATPDSITLSVLDDGSGFTEPTADHKGMGLRIMRYRADMIQAALIIRPAKSSGTQLTCKLPFIASTPRNLP